MYTIDSVDGKLNIPVKLLWNDVKIGFFSSTGKGDWSRKQLFFIQKGRAAIDRFLNLDKTNFLEIWWMGAVESSIIHVFSRCFILFYIYDIWKI